jgi:hypothetical protein
MLAASPHPRVAYIWEPFSPLARPGICPAPFDRWFQYVVEENEGDFRQPVRDMLDYRYHPGAELLAVRSLKDAVRLARDWASVSSRRRAHPIPLLKDPIALFSSEWIADTFDVRVLVLIRHPAAFTNSLLSKRLRHPFEDFLAQPLMMRDLFAHRADEIARFAETEQSPLDQSILLWNLIHEQIARFRETRADWLFRRHEDLSRDAVPCFRDLYECFELTWTDRVERIVREHSGEGNPEETADPTSHRRDSSKAITSWKRRLDPEQIARIREGTEPVCREFYDDDDW